MYELQPVLDQKGLTCRLAAGDDILLNCDAGKMQRVFDNLLRNAVNYSYDGTEITIEAEQGEDSVTLKFSNCGGTMRNCFGVRHLPQYKSPSSPV